MKYILLTIFVLILITSCQDKKVKQQETVFIPFDKPMQFFVADEWTKMCEEGSPDTSCNCAIDFDVKSDSLQISNKKIPLLKRIVYTSSINNQTILSLNVYRNEDMEEILQNRPEKLACFKNSFNTKDYFYMADSCQSTSFNKNSNYPYNSVIRKIKAAIGLK